MYQYLTNCVGIAERDVVHLLAMIDAGREITYRTLQQHVGRDSLADMFPFYNWDQQGGLTMINDYAVSYHKSTYKGRRCYYVRHSAIEYIWVDSTQQDTTDMAHNPDVNGPFASVDAIISANHALGDHFFDTNVMRGFDSRIESSVYGGRYFITSEQFHGSQGSGPRRYTIRRVEDDGEVNTAGGHAAGFQTFAELDDAETFIEAYVEGRATCPTTNGRHLDLWEAMHTT